MRLLGRTTPRAHYGGALSSSVACKTAATHNGYDLGRCTTPAKNAASGRSSAPQPPPWSAATTARPSASTALDVRRVDPKRGWSTWRCPSGACRPASRWVKADRLRPLVPRETPRSKSLHYGRASVGREYGRLNNEWALLPARVRHLTGAAPSRLDDPRQAVCVSERARRAHRGLIRPAARS